MNLKSFLKYQLEILKEQKMCIKAVNKIINAKELLYYEDFILCMDNNKVYTTRTEVVEFIRNNKKFSTKEKVKFLSCNLTVLTKKEYLKQNSLNNEQYNLMKTLVKSL